MTPSDTAAGAQSRAMFLSSASAQPMLRGPAVAYAPDDETGGGGGFSIEEATAQLDTHEDEESAAAPASAPAAAAAPAAGEQTQSEGETKPGDATGEAENQTQDGEQNEGEETAAEPLTAPKYWSQDAKAEFDQLPPSLQAAVLAQEGPREHAAAKAKEEAAQVRAAAEKELAGIQQFAEQVKTWLPQAVQTFRSRWGDNPDWVAYGQQHGAEAMSLARAQYDAERGQLQKAAEASKVADAKAREVYVASEFKALEKLAPDLVDPKEGVARRTEITKYLVDTGYDPEVIRDISAQDMVIARKAMLWDRAQAKSAPNPAPKPVPPVSRPLARGAAAAGPTDPKAKVAAAADSKFRKTGSIEDAVAFLNSQDD